MQEGLVQWTLLQRLDYLSKVLDFRVAAKKGQQITTDFGRIDFVVENPQKRQLIVELETLLDSKSKREYCFSQILNYKHVRYAEKTEYCILFAHETKQSAQTIVQDFGIANNVLIKTYSLNAVKTIYTNCVEQLNQNFGLTLPKPANYTICYLRWLNKILKPFIDYNKEYLSALEVAKYFTSHNTTNFRCYLRLALDFEMIAESRNSFILTSNGEEYTKSFNPDINIATNLSSVDLTVEQKKLLLRIISNGNWTAHKVNIFWLLMFLDVTRGEWIPNIKNFEKHRLDLVNGLFNVSYRSRTMYEFLTFACNWCMELGLVERIKTNTNYDKVYLTPLGIEISNMLQLDLQLKRNRLNLNFKYLE
ncbi:MAG: hypothetical protein EPO24_02515 [Bacteroidetes bacterium]|nr:MAG: hypothetical protein EPO24_02515 [Bacteroidota bacterium]